MSRETTNQLSNVVLRVATPADQPTLRRLAERDSDVVPALPILIAETEGSIAAAWSMSEQRAIADPFVPTAHLITLLREHAGAGGGVRARRRLPGTSLRTLGHAGPRIA